MTCSKYYLKFYIIKFQMRKSEETTDFLIHELKNLQNTI